MTISLGSPGSFQIGVGERGEKSLEMFLEDGDICILDGRDRSAFHAVPRIVDYETAKSNNLHSDYHYYFRLSSGSDNDNFVGLSRIISNWGW